MIPQLMLLGIDVGSTTVKIALVDSVTHELLHSAYRRHGARQRDVTHALLREAGEAFPGAAVKPVFCGSGSRDLAGLLGHSYIQEVVANAVAVRRFHPRTKVSIELGGQDAKVTFFHRDETTGTLVASDMRMNGSCAGGTGAFLDEAAGVLRLRVEELDASAARGEHRYDISGRCGVFAKTDIQPLLNQGAGRDDIARSALHAVAKQTIGGLAQGLKINPPVVFVGGPLTFMPELVAVFAERLELAAADIIRPEHPEIFIAWGAAIGGPQLYPDAVAVSLAELTAAVREAGAVGEAGVVGEAGAVGAAHQAVATSGGARLRDHGPADAAPFFTDEADAERFRARHQSPEPIDPARFAGKPLDLIIGIDAGSTTGKFVAMTIDGELVDEFYAPNQGDPLVVIRDGLRAAKDRWDSLGIDATVRYLATTGYGERLFAEAFGADFHTVETVAHAEAALHYEPRASFVLDIGGQDMKALFLDDGIVTGVTLNEACSAGCGSFLESFARTLDIATSDIAAQAFESDHPSSLG